MSCKPLYSNSFKLLSITIETSLVLMFNPFSYSQKPLKENFQVVSTQIKRPKAHHTRRKSNQPNCKSCVCVCEKQVKLTGLKSRTEKENCLAVLRVQSKNIQFRVHRNLCNLCVVRPPRQFQQQQRVNITSDGSQLFGEGRSWQQHFIF